MSAKEVLGQVCIRDTSSMIRNATEKKRTLSEAEIEGCRERARQYGVKAEVEKLFAAYFDSKKRKSPTKGKQS